MTRKGIKFNYKNFLLAVICVFAVTVILDYLVHGVALTELYQRTHVIWRDPIWGDPASSGMLVLFLSQFFYSILFAFIFTCNFEHKGVPEGLRYGLYIGLLISSTDLASYCYLPVPFILTFSWMLSSVLKGLLAGVAVALIYKSK